ncbi:hypothetical protein THMIRHAS_14720 [Thiosulfatimonas sediminis]|uniref:Small-conductance mechanosensitive channel n=2 Tax=Thiosulfatimonas sediminis TaxID=2675054 RepID=A0A6F8PVF8_9GAMM|nr:hypothetical protein THMIRHAS_14720 [Thiosulfatimonas sediminis]
MQTNDSLWQSATQFINHLIEQNSVWIDVGIIVIAALAVLLVINLILSYLCTHRFSATNTPTGNFVTRAIRYPINISIVLFSLGNIFNLFALSADKVTLIHDLFRSIDIVVWGQFFFRSAKFYLKRFSAFDTEGSFIKPQTLPLLENASAVVIVLFTGYLLFITWDIDMTAWLASAGIIGIAVGFAAKDTVANLLSGVFILADSPYKIGDYIVLDSGERGKVTNIGLRSTRILTRDDLEINIPNSIIANGKIINESAGRDIRSRVRVPVGVAYGTDIDKVRDVLVEVGNQEPEACKDPAPRARFRQFGASSLDFELLVWIDNPEFRGRIIDNLNCAIYKSFHQHGIEIPFSQHDIYIKSLPQELLPQPAEPVKAVNPDFNAEK